MKKLIFFSAFLALTLSVQAQLNPVSWTYTAKKIDDKTYEVHITASIQAGWHLYSQVQPSDAIVDPTAIVFTANPLVKLDGKIKEVGKMEKFRDDNLKISANQYAQKVDFVQIVKLKAKTKTNLAGKVTYQTCDNKKCLPPKTVNFNVQVI
jgi:cytochrome c biogenesis DsbD-like protein